MSDFLAHSLFFGAGITLVCYEVGLLLRRRFRLAILNPLLLASLCVMAVIKLLGVSYPDYNSGARYLTYLLTPATVALAVPLYEQLQLLRRNLAAILGSILAGTLAGLTGIFLMSRCFGLSHQLYVSFLPKSITTAIGIGVCEELGGYVSISVAVIIITGVIGGIFAEKWLKLLRITDPIARGIALGSSAHAIGTAKAMELGPIEGSMSSLSIVVCGIITVIAAPFFAPLL